MSHIRVRLSFSIAAAFAHFSCFCLLPSLPLDHLKQIATMVPRPRTPEPRPEAGGSNSDDAIDPSGRPAGTTNTAGTTLVAPLAMAGSPTRRARRSRDGAATGDHGERSAAAAAAAKYGPSSGAGGSLRRHVLSSIGGGRVARRPVVQRSLRRICTLALPSLHPDEDKQDTLDIRGASGATDQPQPQQKGGAAASVQPMSRHPSQSSIEKADGDSDARSVSSRLSHATGTTAPATNTSTTSRRWRSRSLTLCNGKTDRAAINSNINFSNSSRLKSPFRHRGQALLPGCSPQIVFRRYIAAATDDGRVCIFAVRAV